MKLVITGGSGFLGSHLLEECRISGVEVYALKRVDTGIERLQNKGFNIIYYSDILESELIASLSGIKPSIFIHFAWKGIEPGDRNAEDQVEYNLSLMQHTVMLAEKIGCTHWVGIGSLAEYGLFSEKINEKFLPNPVSIYGKAKLAACWSSSALCQALHIKWSWIRLGSIYGPGDNPKWLIPYVIKNFSAGLAPALTPSEQLWDYLYVSDAAKAILSICNNSSAGIFNLASGEVYSIRDIVFSIKRIMQTDIEPNFGGIQYSEKQSMYMGADITKIKRVANWKPNVGLSEGLHRTIFNH